LRGTFTTAGGDARVEIGLNHEGLVQWLDLEDRLAPSESPILVDEWKLLEAVGTAYVIVRPVGALAQAFSGWQGQTLDRIGVRCAAPAGHATLKAFGARDSPLSGEDERRIVEVVQAWAASCGGLELRATAIEILAEDGIPIVRLDASAILPAMSDLRSASADGGLPIAESDRIALDGWIPHLSLAYPVDRDAARWHELEGWMREVQATVSASCVALQAEVVTYAGGAERRLGAFPLEG